MSDQRSWYLIHTKPRMEKQAEENLNRQNYETYLPMVKTRRRRNSRYIKVVEAFFSRYLFIYLSSKTDNWAPIRSTIGVSLLVYFGGVPVMVPHDVVATLIANEDHEGFQKFNLDRIKLGDRINISDGPFKGLNGIFIKCKSSERVVILLDVIGQSSKITLGMNNLNIVDSIRI